MVDEEQAQEQPVEAPKRRGPYGRRALGYRPANTKLTWDDVRAIRAELAQAAKWDGTKQRLAQQYGVSIGNIRAIELRRSWQRDPDAPIAS